MTPPYEQRSFLCIGCDQKVDIELANRCEICWVLFCEDCFEEHESEGCPEGRS